MIHAARILLIAIVVIITPTKDRKEDMGRMKDELCRGEFCKEIVPKI